MWCHLPARFSYYPKEPVNRINPRFNTNGSRWRKERCRARRRRRWFGNRRPERPIQALRHPNRWRRRSISPKLNILICSSKNFKGFGENVKLFSVNCFQMCGLSYFDVESCFHWFNQRRETAWKYLHLSSPVLSIWRSNAQVKCID